MSVSDALRPLASGVLLGTTALFFTVRAIEHMLYGVTVLDPTTLVATGALLTIVVLTAAFWPARRAASVDPVRAMRAD